VIRRLRPFRHVLPLVALVFAAAAWAFPPYSGTDAGFGLALEPLAIATALVGWLLTTRRPESPIGWIFSLWSVAVGFNAFAGQYAARGWYAHPGSLPGVPWVAWVATIVWHPGFGMFVLILLLFPTGKALTARWRRFALFAIGWYAALAVAVALSPKAVFESFYPHLAPPFHEPIGAAGEVAYGLLLTGNLGLVFIALVSQVLRYRASPEAERYQIKWFVWPVVTGLCIVLASFSVFGNGTLFPFMLPLIPITVGIAILRYRLYDIDRVVSRSVAWLLLTVVVVGVYVGVVAGATALLPGSSSVAVAAATLAAAAVFEPARRRLQASVDRRFNRERYNAAQLVDVFAGGLRESVDLSRVEHELLDVTTRSMQPASVSLWLPTVDTPA
jgi:hypothetical protein